MPRLPILFLYICLLWISKFNKLQLSMSIFKDVSVNVKSLTCKDVTKRESQGLV